MTDFYNENRHPGRRKSDQAGHIVGDDADSDAMSVSGQTDNSTAREIDITIESDGVDVAIENYERVHLRVRSILH